jgi:hypothetical protein
MATKPLRSDSGIQMATGSASWQGSTGVGGIYYKTGVGLVMRKTDNTEVTLGSGGGGVTWPLTNSTSPFTALYAGTMTGSTAAYQLDSTNAYGVGDKISFRSAGVEFMKLTQSFSGLWDFVSANANIGMVNSTGDGIRAQGANSVYIYGAGAAQVLFLANNGVIPQVAGLTNGSLATPWGTSYMTSVVIPQTVATSGSPTAALLTGAAHTTLAASTEAPDVDLALNRIVQFSSGALTTQRAMVIRAPTYSFTGASTLTTASTLSITGAPVAGTNATITNKYALNLEAGDLNLNASGAKIIAHHYASRGSAPTIAVGAAAQLGTSPAAAVVASSTDTSGTLSITTGTTPSALTANTSILGATVTFNATYSSAPKGIVLVPSNSAAAALATGTAGIAFYADQASTSTSAWVIRIVSSGANTLAASTAYQFAYHVIQ